MDQGWTNNPNVASSRYPTNFWGLLGLVAPIVHTTQQNFLIGSFAKSDSFHWLRHCCQYLNQYPLSPNEIFPTDTSYIYISTKHLIFHMLIFEPTLSKLCYNGEKFPQDQTHASLGVMRYRNQFQLILCKIFATYNSFYRVSETHLTFFTETHGNAIFCHKVRKRACMGTQKDASGWQMSFFQDQPMTTDRS